MSISNNPILTSDSYKYSHFMQYPKDTAGISSYITARGTTLENCDGVIALGIQSAMKKLAAIRISQSNVLEAEKFCESHGIPFNREGWEIIVNEYDGRLPLIIQAAPEGMEIPFGMPILQVTNTDNRLAWLTSFYERFLLCEIWYPSTVATMSRQIKKIIKEYLDKTSDNADEELPFKLHDFGYRGVSSEETAARGGFAHLVNFMGTDTVAGITHAMDNYHADMCGFSISASEHSTMTSWGREGEFDAYRNMVDSYAKTGAIFACVIDSYDTMAAVDMFCDDSRMVGGSLLDVVENRGARIVLRPDSGDPVWMPIDVIARLMDKVGYTVNSKGYKVLPDHVRVIQGDGIDIEDIKNILYQMEKLKISAENITFGMGGGLLQKVNRDTFKFAMKASARLDNNGVWHDVKKDPVTDKSKTSRGGRLDLRQLPTGAIFSPDLGYSTDIGVRIFEYVYACYKLYDGDGNPGPLHFGVKTDTTLDMIRERAKL